MVARTLFEVEQLPQKQKKPRKTPEKLMHVYDAGGAESGECIAVFLCGRCGYKSDWLNVGTVTAAKRGLPCPKCNASE